jgi:CheY-like chemotaxis protein
MFSPEEQREYLDVINLKSKQLLQIINNIIDISKIEASQIKVQYKSFSVNQLLKEVFEEYQIELKECKKEHIHLAIPDETLYKDIIIESDKSRLRQVLSNLISNAVKYTEEGNIEIGYIREHTQLKFYVKDTGIGISPDKLNVIFQRFRQAEDYSTRKYGGTGLGLSISKHLIELLGGTIWVDSKEHEGSCFYFTIPLHKAQTDSSQQAESENVTNATEKTYEKEYNWNGKNILIVEDDLGSLQLMQAVICRTNAHCIICKTGKEAIEKFNKYKDQVSIVLLDIQLPDLHGSEIIEYIKNKREDLPVIAQTAHAMDGDQTKYLSQGFDDYISKPIKATKLLTKINDFFINPTLHSD